LFAELQYWRARVTNLESVFVQLQEPRVHKMALILAGTDSAYYPSFAALFKNIVAGE
jgi:dynein heavy chain